MTMQPTFSNVVSAPGYESRNFVWMTNRWIEDRLTTLASIGRNKTGLAKRLGLPSPRVTEIINGDRKVSVTELEPLSEYLDMPISAVLTNLGAASSGAKFLDLGTLVPVDVVGFVQAGFFREALDIPFDDRSKVMIKNIPGAKNLFGLEVRGDSMNKEFNHGDVLICQSLHDFCGPVEDEMFVVVERRHEGLIEATVKQLEIRKDGQYWLHPRSDNPEFTEAHRVPPQSEWDGDETSEYRVVGVVLTAIQNKLPSH